MCESIFLLWNYGSVQKVDVAFGICVSFLTWSLFIYLSILDYCEYFVLLRQSNCV